jgi:SAM-dependent methyltransferase
MTVKEPMNGLSEEVQAFYERMPYPAPFASLDEHSDLYRNPDRRRAQFHIFWPTEPFQAEREILIAGCGTSQAARFALREPAARITAIDISENSLGHTRELQQKYKLDNLDLRHLPIERVHELGRTFDQIICTGVLHHLPDPDAGLRALRDVLDQQGAIRLMVYAAYGRAGIYMIKEYCRLLGLSASDDDLHALVAALEALPAGHPITALMRSGLDFRSPDALADALLHPIDRAYTVPQLYEWLDRCGVSFGRWFEQAPYLPQCGMIKKTPLAERLAALAPQLQHAAIELFRGTMVKHDLIVYRDDREGECQPIRFQDNRWRSYVPIAVPWTVRVRERLPKGIVAVLINRAHSFTDLICTVDKLEDELLEAIDGTRTLAEILKVTGREGDESHALAFFERLWQYDQIVFQTGRSY